MSQTGTESDSTARAPMAMSIDVEDWFHVENLKSAIPRGSWDGRELRVEANTDRMLAMLAEHGARSTFFVLGWVAERCPDLVRRIAAAGHEVASHGYGHQLLGELTPDSFREDVARSKAMLEDLSGQAVVGYRAPSFSITDWAIPVLRELGFRYDSSAFPTVAHDRYGKLAGVSAKQAIAELEGGVQEVCISCLTVGSVALPWGGGGYFRLVPYPAFRRGVARIAAERPYVFYLHPWEIDPGQPRVPDLPALHRLRHYVGINRARDRWGSLLADFRWTTIADLLAHEERAPTTSS
jgi:polysaccharide deacetylase family protein (PEP-CTERM system associated)